MLIDGVEQGDGVGFVAEEDVGQLCGVQAGAHTPLRAVPRSRLACHRREVSKKLYMLYITRITED